eukprot:tig00000133_g7659.t1
MDAEDGLGKERGRGEACSAPTSGSGQEVVNAGGSSTGIAGPAPAAAAVARRRRLSSLSSSSLPAQCPASSSPSSPHDGAASFVISDGRREGALRRGVAALGRAAARALLLLAGRRSEPAPPPPTHLHDDDSFPPHLHDPVDRPRRAPLGFSSSPSFASASAKEPLPAPGNLTEIVDVSVEIFFGGFGAPAALYY